MSKLKGKNADESWTTTDGPLTQEMLYRILKNIGLNAVPQWGGFQFRGSSDRRFDRAVTVLRKRKFVFFENGKWHMTEDGRQHLIEVGAS